MKKFSIETIQIISKYRVFEVEAHSEQEAKKLVLLGEVEEVSVEEIPGEDIQIDFVEEIGED